jgi:hypothetical protein
MNDKHVWQVCFDVRPHRDGHSRVEVKCKPSIGNRSGCTVGHFLQFSTIAKREGSGGGVHKAQSTEPNLMLENEWGASVEADVWGARDKRIECKALVHQGIVNNEDVVAENGEVAEREVTRSANFVDSELCPEDLKIYTQQRDNRGFDLKMPCCFRTQIVKLWHDQIIHEAARVKYAQPLFFVRSQGKICHSLTRI